MAANKRRQDEKHLKMLRELVTLAHNKQCFDCHQRGPTYVNMTIGSFVCTSCSGILRGLNPPHRVKSISMTSFTPEEMEFLKSRGNDFCRKVWLGLYDSRSFTDIDSKDESKVRDFMAQKYEKKRWYVAPTEAMHEEARKQNTPVAKTDSKPQKSLGNHMPAIQTSQLQRGSRIQRIHPHSAASHHFPGVDSAKPVGGPAPVQAVQRPHTGVNASPVNPAAVTSPTANQAPPPKSASGLNLLDDLGGDPFAGPTSNVSNNSTSSPGDFANFANFNSMTTQQQPASTPQSAFPTQDFSGAGVLQPSSGSVATSSSAGFASFPAPTSSATTTPSGDKYAALADLDSVFGSSVFGGTSSSGGGPVFGGTGTQVSAGNGSVGWNGTSVSSAPSGGPIPWGNMPTSSAPSTGAGLQQGGQTTASVAGYMPPASNPFGAQTSSTVGGNPFMSQATSTAAGFGQFGQPPMPAGPGFGVPGSYAGATTTSTAAGHGGQFGAVQNGGWGYPAAPQGPYPGAMPPTYAAATMPGFAAKPPQGAAAPGYGGVMPQQGQFAGWPVQQAPVGNPFMSGAGQQAVPPRSNSTNPFL